MSGFSDLEGKVEVKEFKRITGLAPVRVLAVNPTEEKYRGLTGLEAPYEFDYSAKPNVSRDNRLERPIVFLLHNEEYDIYQLKTIGLCDQEVEFSEGKKQWIDKRGNVTYAAKTLDEIVNNPKMEWANYDKDSMRPIKYGERDLYKFLMTLGNLTSHSKESNFLEVFEKSGGTFERLYNGDVSAIQQYLEWVDTNEDASGKVAIPFVIREKIDEETNTSRYYQDSLLYADVIYPTNKAGEVLSSSIQKFRELNEDKFSRTDKHLTGKWFTYSIQEFVLEDCVNYDKAPEGVKEEDTSGWV